MAVARITKSLIEAARVPAGKRFIQYRDRDVVGLTWRLYASGRAAWYLTYRVAGKLKWFRIADGWALAPEQARREARRRRTRSPSSDPNGRSTIGGEFRP